MEKTIDAGKVCEKCGTVLVPPKTVYFCDQCQEKISDKPLRFAVFFKDNSTFDYEFCSWDCFFDWIKDMRLNKNKISFISIESLGTGGGDFIEQYNEFLDAISLED